MEVENKKININYWQRFTFCEKITFAVMEFLNYRLNTPGFFGGKREVQNLGRLKNAIKNIIHQEYFY